LSFTGPKIPEPLEGAAGARPKGTRMRS
jgi:hypothetical protein